MVGQIVSVTDKGYGFIKPRDGSEDVFFHYKSLRGEFTGACLADIKYKMVDYTCHIDPQSGRVRASEVHPAGAN